MLSSRFLYSHICHKFPIATLCYIFLSDFSSLAFALMRYRRQGKHKWNHIMEQGEKTAKNHCAATVLEDFVNALWRVITALDFYKFKLEFNSLQLSLVFYLHSLFLGLWKTRRDTTQEELAINSLVRFDELFGRIFALHYFLFRQQIHKPLRYSSL